MRCVFSSELGVVYIASISIHSIRIFGWFSHFRMVFIHFRSTHFNEFRPTTGQGGNLFLHTKNSLSLNHNYGKFIAKSALVLVTFVTLLQLALLLVLYFNYITLLERHCCADSMFFG